MDANITNKKKIIKNLNKAYFKVRVSSTWFNGGRGLVVGLGTGLISRPGQWDPLGGAEGTWEWGGCKALGSSASLQHLLGANGACCWLPHQERHLHHGMGLGFLTRGTKQNWDFL